MSTQHDFDSPAEKNARIRARGDYRRWLRRRYGSSDMREMIDAETPIALHKMYIPVRLTEEDIADDSMAKVPELMTTENKGKMLGVDAWDLILQERFVLVSGRPGSGKTTLIKSIINDLCANYPSQFRKELMAKHGIAPIPLMLREIENLHAIQSFEELMAAWWRMLERQNYTEKHPLDICRLQDSFDLKKANYPCLYLFDGLDEVGGVKTRQWLMKMAMLAANYGHRVLVTSRPSGFDSLELLPHKVHHLSPLSWPLIEKFIADWYQLRTEWQHAKRHGIPSFLSALKNEKRPYLLTLARRPIFITLMALIHCERNEMPHARAELYEAIVDIYLNRQAKHRQLKFTTKGHDMPHWSSQELRMLLSYVAWQSQRKSSSLGGAQHQQDSRRIIWQRQELADLIRAQIKAGRFSDVQPSDSQAVIDYFLNPAGLLIEPEIDQIQFAHLSFQEYLCAEHVLGKLRARKFEHDIKKELFDQLSKPGWDEISILLLTIHARKTQNEGHFEILAMLDITDKQQAKLLLHAICGQELPITTEDRIQWLAVMIGAVLLHPSEHLGELFCPWPELETMSSSLLKQILKTESSEKQWMLLTDRMTQSLARGLNTLDAEDIAEHSMLIKAKEQWLNPDLQKTRAFDAEDFRFYACLCFWQDISWRQKQQESELEEVLTLKIEKAKLWKYVKDKDINFPIDSEAMGSLRLVSKYFKDIFQVIDKKCPLDVYVLQDLGLASIHHDIKKSDPCLGFLLHLHLHLLQSLTYTTQINVNYIEEMASIVCRWEKKKSRGHIMVYGDDALDRNILSPIKNRFNLSLFPLKIREKLTKIRDNVQYVKQQEQLRKILCLFELQRDVLRVFKKKYEDHEYRLVGDPIPYSPAPQSLGLFDAKGLPHHFQKRENWLHLRAYLDDFEAILKFVFPNGLASSERKRLMDDMYQLKGQPWSPQAAVDTVLATWPEGELERDCSLAAVEQRCLQACEALVVDVKGE